MFVTRKFYEELVKAQAEARALAEQVAGLKATLEWTRVQLTQVSKERAQLLYASVGAKFAVPEFVQNPASAATGTFLNDLPSLEDIGDEEATRLGVGWDVEGRVKYSPTKS